MNTLIKKALTVAIPSMLFAMSGLANATLKEGLDALEAKDYKLALEKFHQCPNAEQTSCAFYLGNLYRDGLGTSVDYDKAVIYYRQAMLVNHPEALMSLGTMYANGEGVEQNSNTAVKLFMRSAEKGNTYAMVALGVVYTHGLKGLPPDGEVAGGWFAKASDAGNKEAMTYMGKLYQQGAPGLEPSIQGATYSWCIAARNGSQDAKDLLAQTYKGKKQAIVKTNTQMVSRADEEATLVQDLKSGTKLHVILNIPKAKEMAVYDPTTYNFGYVAKSSLKNP